MFTGIAVLAGLAIGLTSLLFVSARLIGTKKTSIADDIERLLPRIQCGQCGYPGCRQYAEAIAAETADINCCPPGGMGTIRELAHLVGREPLSLDESLGHASMDRVAKIDETTCIGCNLCLRACPVDAIIGVHQFMHTIISSHCTGCELCLAPCPVDCIQMVARHA